MKLTPLVIGLFLLGCSTSVEKNAEKANVSENGKTNTKASLIILGTTQDAGSPQIGCTKKCCASLFENGYSDRKIVSLGLLIPDKGKKYLIEATPDITSQAQLLSNALNSGSNELPDGIFVTHAHIGHYTGLMQLGKEAINAEKVPVYAMPKMKSFLEENGPWSQLVSDWNILLVGINDSSSVSLENGINITPMLVPHRDEFSETIGYKIQGPTKSALFIPDIDKWSKWLENIEQEISAVDYAFIDGTFFDSPEINHRDISEIPHPFVVESMQLFEDLPLSEKNKIYFIHFNHTNPLLDSESSAFNKVEANGFHVAQMMDVFEL
jgi:pyrroloquinoline quinone biosynthesis protein B